MKNKNIARLVGASAHALKPRQPNDYYATDPHALQGLLTAMSKDGLLLCENVWEPACGEGNLSNFLISKNYEVFATDLIDYNGNQTFDFLSEDDNIKWCGDILTNPPYKLAQKFVEQSLNRTNIGKHTFMLLRIQFLEGQARNRFFQKNPPKYVYVHSSRIMIRRNNDPSIKGNHMAFAWFVWENGYEGETIVRWIP